MILSFHPPRASPASTEKRDLARRFSPVFAENSANAGKKVTVSALLHSLDAPILALASVTLHLFDVENRA
ncbi:MAG: hypothetical protein KJ872_08445 [Alphaproteobacteria bacterium]|nr:hypothetical protein [Alphaproteobacteria bacterium]